MQPDSRCALQDLGSAKGLGPALAALTDALERALPAGQSLKCLVQLAGNGDAGVARRALKLFGSRIAALARPAGVAATTMSAAPLAAFRAQRMY